MNSKLLPFAILLMLTLAGGKISLAVEPEKGLHSANGMEDPPDFSVVPDAQWLAIERSVDRGIEYMLSQQNSDGSFGIGELERPAVTSLVCMAMISRGHASDESPSASHASQTIVRGIDYVLSRQRDDGLLGHSQHSLSLSEYSKFMIYNHSICGMFLTEVYGMTGPKRAKRIEVAVNKALSFVRVLQQRSIPAAGESRDRGGWRYLDPPQHGDFYSDLSVTSWIVMFLRSAENAGFNVPIEWAKQAIAYVVRCYDERSGAFSYAPGHSHMVTRGMVGAGVVCLFLTGHKEPDMEQRCGKWILAHPYDRYNQKLNSFEHYHYGAYYQSQAALQIGGQTWERFYPRFVDTFLSHQNRDGSWQPEGKRPELGRAYTTAMAVLALTPPYQLLPIYQR
ncbi:prenyltransferase/squalene oxidase repeat-containing protein [Rhodopirellula sp. SWK7]|uniref:prenyltransferase/squalene oxidase repeat-containing protein n=1 Tax=Rhodopirellula sp. SWK7 TaxID=595460 RepID=UPI0002BE6BA0|nr:prenyltransferase/squalene oxidase repeat-containing protein [Rhodopirellula sp. SWK7]EMI40610.1 putative secreted protein [Rhodopirellula sp. SWK7]